METIAALILYEIFFYLITSFFNKVSLKKINTTFALIMKISMRILLIIDILAYFIIKFKEYSFYWTI